MTRSAGRSLTFYITIVFLGSLSILASDAVAQLSGASYPVDQATPPGRGQAMPYPQAAPPRTSQYAPTPSRSANPQQVTHSGDWRPTRPNTAFSNVAPAAAGRQQQLYPAVEQQPSAQSYPDTYRVPPPATQANSYRSHPPNRQATFPAAGRETVVQFLPEQPNCPRFSPVDSINLRIKSRKPIPPFRPE